MQNSTKNCTRTQFCEWQMEKYDISVIKFNYNMF